MAAIPPGAPAPNPTDPQYARAMQEMVAKAGTNGINDIFVYLAIGTILVLLLSFALPSRKSLLAEEKAAEERGEGPEALPVHVG